MCKFAQLYACHELFLNCTFTYVIVKDRHLLIQQEVHQPIERHLVYNCQSIVMQMVKFLHVEETTLSGQLIKQQVIHLMSDVSSTITYVNVQLRNNSWHA
jgi:hypothetical protein